MCELSKRENFDSTVIDKFDLTANNHFLTSLVGTGVSVYFVTPLINFSFSSPAGIRMLSEEFASHVGKLKTSAVGTARKRDQAFGSCLEFTVKSGRKTLYNSYLFAIFDDDGFTGKSSAQFPFMCVKEGSRVRIEKWAKNFIEERFLCTVGECRLSDSQMQWLLGISAKETLGRHSNDGMVLTFRFPGSSDATVEVNWAAESLQQVWEACSANEEEHVIYLETIVKFVLAMSEHNLNTYGVDLSSFNLIRISLLGVILISQRRTLNVFAFHPEIFYAILYFLYVECVQTNQYLRPSFAQKLAPFERWEPDIPITESRNRLKKPHEKVQGKSHA